MGYRPRAGELGIFGGDLLVGNFSFVESEINAFDPLSGAFLGTIDIDPGLGHGPGGLLVPGLRYWRHERQPNTLYFTDGIDAERHGLFGAITPLSEPSTLALLGIGALILFALRPRFTSA